MSSDTSASKSQCHARQASGPKQLSEKVEAIRHELAGIRGRLTDLRYESPGWGEHTRCVEGLLTCGLVSLYETRTQMIASERLFAKAASIEPQVPVSQANEPEE